MLPPNLVNISESFSDCRRIMPNFFSAAILLGIALGLFYAAYWVFNNVAPLVAIFPALLGLGALASIFESAPGGASAVSNHDPENQASHHYRLGNAALRDNRLHEAIQHYETAIWYNPNGWPAHANMGAAHMSLRQYDQALSAMNTALAINPAEWGTIGNRSRVRRELGDYAGSLADINDAIEYEPSNPSHYINRNQTRRCLGDFKGAISDCTEGLKRTSAYGPEIEAVLYYHRAMGKYNLEDWSGAVGDLNRAIAADPKYAYAFLWRGATNLNQGKTDEALEDYYAGFKLCTGAQGMLLRDSLSHLEQERFSEALTLLRQAAVEDDSLVALIKTFEQDLAMAR
jgi:tetratricopeptide (TPR) repeat protein